VANAGASVLFTIHQPSSEIFNSFDHLILMNKGRVMYQGPVNQVPEYFGARSNPVPPNYNPADWIMVRCPDDVFFLRCDAMQLIFLYRCARVFSGRMSLNPCR
jgi:ABC-2 type transporter